MLADSQVVTEIYTASAVEMGRAMEAAPRSVRDMLHIYIRSSLTFIAEHRTEIQVLGEIFLNLRRPTGELVYGLTEEEPLLAALEEGCQQARRQASFARSIPV